MGCSTPPSDYVRYVTNNATLICDHPRNAAWTLRASFVGTGTCNSHDTTDSYMHDREGWASCGARARACLSPGTPHPHAVSGPAQKKRRRPRLTLEGRADPPQKNALAAPDFHGKSTLHLAHREKDNETKSTS